MYQPLFLHRLTHLHQLAKTVNLRNTPQITFILDDSIEYGVRMSKMIDEVTSDDNE